jgi:hypothetical protein
MAVIRALNSVAFDLFATVPKRMAAHARMEAPSARRSASPVTRASADPVMAIARI